jgi:hypothetical protein
MAAALPERLEQVYVGWPRAALERNPLMTLRLERGMSTPEFLAQDGPDKCWLPIPSRSAMTAFLAPSAAINIIRARSAVACPVERRRTKDSSSSRSATDKTIETAALPRAIPASIIGRQNYDRNFSISKLLDQYTSYRGRWTRGESAGRFRRTINRLKFAIAAGSGHSPPISARCKALILLRRLRAPRSKMLSSLRFRQNSPR